MGILLRLMAGWPTPPSFGGVGILLRLVARRSGGQDKRSPKPPEVTRSAHRLVNTPSLPMFDCGLVYLDLLFQ